MVSKVLLAGIIIGVAGIFALPATVAMFSGQHMWYATDVTSGGDEAGVPCGKCHADVAEEMDLLTGPHTGETGYGQFKCEYCHKFPPVWRRNQTFEDYTKEAHASSTVPCMYCHSGDKYGVKHTNAANFDCWSCHHDPGQNPSRRPAHEGRYTNSEDCRRCHGNATTGDVYYIPPAGGFSLTTNASDTGKNASHNGFVIGAIGDETMEDANEACIACHTESRAEIEFTVPTGMKITVHNTYTQTQSHWDIINIEPISYTTYREVKGG